MQTVKHISTHPNVAKELAEREQVSKYLLRPLRTYEEAQRDRAELEQRKGEAA